MKPRELEKLLGGWAAGSLTAEERKELLRASLDDQRLFDALADEEGLRELLADPPARAELLDQLTARAPVAAPQGHSWFRPVLAMAATVFVAFIGIGVWRMQYKEASVVHETVLITAPEQAAPPVGEPQAEADAEREQQPARPVTRREEPREFVAPRPAATAPSPPAELPSPPEVDNRKIAADVPPPQGAAEIAAAPPPPAKPQPEAVTQQKAMIADSSEIRFAHAAEGAAGPGIAALSWTVQRKQGETFVDVPGGAALRAGDEVRLRLRSRQVGAVTIRFSQDQSTVMQVLPNRPLDIPLPPAVTSEPGDRRLQIAFVPQQPPGFARLRSGAAKTDVGSMFITLRFE